ncbi:hypothetical protein ACJJTC_005144 [Scirpophaga incertulas]
MAAGQTDAAVGCSEVTNIQNMRSHIHIRIRLIHRYNENCALCQNNIRLDIEIVTFANARVRHVIRGKATNVEMSSSATGAGHTARPVLGQLGARGSRAAAGLASRAPPRFSAASAGLTHRALAYCACMGTRGIHEI